MNISDEMKIDLSKKKCLLYIVGSAVFVVLGFWLLSLDSEAIRPLRLFLSPILVHGIGWAGVVFFGLCGIVGVRKLFDKRPGLRFTKTGLIDNSSGVSVGLIPWSDILGTEIYRIQRQRILLVKVANPEKYIETGGPLKRWAKKANFKMYGSPISISSNALKIDFDKLVDVFNAYISRYGVNA